MRPVMAVAANLRLRRPRTAEDQVLSRRRDKTASVDTVIVPGKTGRHPAVTGPH